MTAIYNLLDPLEEEDEFVEITVGGQACEFPQKYIVSELKDSPIHEQQIGQCIAIGTTVDGVSDHLDLAQK